MSVLDRLAYRIGQLRGQFNIGKTSTVSNPPAWLRATAEMEAYNLPDLSVAQNQADLFGRLSWVNIAVTHVAQQAASAQLHVRELIGEEEQEEINHPVEQLLRRPNPVQSRFEFLQDMF
jgi:phage portal protein BeeE